VNQTAPTASLTGPAAQALQQRRNVAADTDRRGMRGAKELAEATDEWLRHLWEDACGDTPLNKPAALVAIGGYGRGELAPFSDLDVLLVHDGAKNFDAVATKLWYPIWDAGVKLGHSVSTIKQALELAKTELDTATSLLTVRYIAGDRSLCDTLATEARRAWTNQASGRLSELMDRVRRRQSENGEVAFLLEPNIKEGCGGLRDIHAVQWAALGGLEISRPDWAALEAGRDVLTAVRVALHRHAGRSGDVIHLEDQDAVASLCGYPSADSLMGAVSTAGRSVAWVGDELWARVAAANIKKVPDRALAPGVVLRQGEIHLDDTIDPATDPTLLLRVAAAAAREQARIDRITLDRLAQDCPPLPSPWPAGAIDDLVGLLLAGRRAIPVLEALDQRGLWVRILPEWAPNRSRPQRNAYHRFTVDRHLWEATANAAERVDRVSRPDLLVLGALFHDIGKGYPGDHTEVGMDLVRKMGPRLGLNHDDTDLVCAMVEHHLLLPDVATRRDLADPSTITAVADAVRTPVLLELLHMLTESDSLATGPSAWGSWKSELVDDLVNRVRLVLGGADISTAQWRLFPDAEVLAMMASGDTQVRTEETAVTVVSADRPGTFSRVAGVLALHGLNVLGAQAHSDEQGMAASRFRVAPPDHGPIEWNPVVANLQRALRGELALEARLAERATTYKRRRRSADAPAAPRVTFFDEASSNATVIEVRAPDQMGILYRVTKALAELGLDIRHATVQTMGDEVVDAFYVRTQDGAKITDDFHRREIERAIVFTLTA
jgi:[protein-PII] uridylyltransferase